MIKGLCFGKQKQKVKPEIYIKIKLRFTFQYHMSACLYMFYKKKKKNNIKSWENMPQIKCTNRRKLKFSFVTFDTLQ